LHAANVAEDQLAVGTEARVIHVLKFATKMAGLVQVFIF
jgi:hypothetical protein